MFEKTWNGHTTIPVVTNSVTDVVQAYKAANATGIDLSTNDFDLAKLASRIEIKALVIKTIGGQSEVDWSGIKVFSQLDELMILDHGFDGTIHLDWFPKLTAATVRKNTIVTQQCTAKKLYVYCYPKQCKTIDNMELPDNIEELILWNAPLVSLKGIERYQKLKILHIALARRLQDISQTNQLLNLVDLKFAHAPKVDYSTLDNPYLRYLIIQCSSLPSVKFLNQIPNLELFTTFAKITDGDRTPLFSRKWHGSSYVKGVKLEYF
jgi:hypothetical protein